VDSPAVTAAVAAVVLVQLLVALVEMALPQSGFISED
jgi:hypothetical protein